MKQKDSIVFLSGLLCDERVWFEVANNLKDIATTHLISFKGLDSIENMAKKVLDNSPSTFCLVGHSMGGRVALEIMKQAPHRVKKLALFNTGIHGVSETEIKGREVLINLAKEEGIHSIVKQWLPPMMSTTGLSKPTLMENLEKMVTSYSVDDFLKQIYALINRPNAEDILSSITIPTLLSSATEDKWSSVSQHQEIQKRIPNSKLAIIEDAGHMAPVEVPDVVSSVIKDWFLNQTN